MSIISAEDQKLAVVSTKCLLACVSMVDNKLANDYTLLLKKTTPTNRYRRAVRQ